MDWTMARKYERVYQIDLECDSVTLVSAQPPAEARGVAAFFTDRIETCVAEPDRKALLDLLEPGRLGECLADADAWEAEYIRTDGETPRRERCELDVTGRDAGGAPVGLCLCLRALGSAHGDRVATLEAVCRSVLTGHYEEIWLVDSHTGDVDPLQESREALPGGLFRQGRGSYDECVREMIESRAFEQQDREQLATLLLARLEPELRAAGSQTVRCRLKGDDGAAVWKQIECAFFLPGDARILLLVADVQQEEDVKSQLREAAEAAQSANRAKSAFLANMSHEIRTPMNAIVGISEMLLRRELAPDILNSISTIQNSGASLLGIINDILDFSKIETGKFEIIDVEYMLPSLLMDLSNVISVRLASKPVYFMMDIDPKLPNHFIGDDIRMKQILLNLIGNAVKFTHEGSIELKVRGKALEDGKFELSFDVADTGIGIKPEDLDKLFHTFSQVDTRKNRATTGSGLGLVISRNLARLMGGDLTVRSTYGKGSVFSVKVIQQVPRYVPLGEVRDKRVRVLICEQNESIVRSLSGALEHLELPYDICREIDRVRDYPGMSHVLVRRRIFEKIQEKLEFMFEKSNILLILDNDEQAESAFMEYQQLQLPLITLQLINALNGEEIVSSVRKKSFDRSEIVPLTFAHVLVVDDNTTNLQVAQGLMLPYKMHIDTTTSGFKAIEMVKKTRYDAIFMDHMMPEMDGIETARFIRGMEGDYFKHVPIIALTANAMSDARDLFLEAGMDDFVAKPIEMRELHRVIKKYIQSRAPEGYLQAARSAAQAEAEAEAEKAAKAPAGKAPAAPTVPAAKAPAPALISAAPLAEGAMGALLQQNNLLLEQNMRLLNALLGGAAPAPTETATPAATATPAPQADDAPAPAVPAAEEAPEAEPEAIPGVDMRKSIESYGGSVEVYHNILKTYSADIREKEGTLRQLVQDHDIQNFTIQVHAVKSASRSVGAFDLGESAYKLEMAGKAGDWDTIARDYPAFDGALHEMVEHVGEYVRKNLGGGDADREYAEALDEELVKGLKEACEQMNYLDAESILSQLRQKRYPPELEEKLDKLQECCRTYDYDLLDTLALKL